MPNRRSGVGSSNHPFTPSAGRSAAPWPAVASATSTVGRAFAPPVARAARGASGQPGCACEGAWRREVPCSSATTVRPKSRCAAGNRTRRERATPRSVRHPAKASTASSPAAPSGATMAMRAPSRGATRSQMARSSSAGAVRPRSRLGAVPAPETPESDSIDRRVGASVRATSSVSSAPTGPSTSEAPASTARSAAARGDGAVSKTITLMRLPASASETSETTRFPIAACLPVVGARSASTGTAEAGASAASAGSAARRRAASSARHLTVPPLRRASKRGRLSRNGALGGPPPALTTPRPTAPATAAAASR